LFAFDSKPRLSSGTVRGLRGFTDLQRQAARLDYSTEESNFTLGLTQLEGSHFLDNPASARVLEKLGFEPLGITTPRLSCARGIEAQARMMRLALAEELEEAESLAA